MPLEQEHLMALSFTLVFKGVNLPGQLLHLLINERNSNLHPHSRGRKLQLPWTHMTISLMGPPERLLRVILRTLSFSFTY